MINVKINFELKGVKKAEMKRDDGSLFEYYQAVTFDKKTIGINKKLYDAFKDGSYKSLDLGIEINDKGKIRFVDNDDFGDIEELEEF